jgi:hypothetical protein
MKKLLSLCATVTLVIALSFGLTACGNNNNNDPENPTGHIGT